MSFSPYSYAAKPRHGFGAPAEGDFDSPSYLSGGPGLVALGENDYGFAPLAAVPLWVWLAGGTAATVGGTYWYASQEGESKAAAAAAQAQAQGAPPVVPQQQQNYYEPPPSPPGVTSQAWFWPMVVGGGVLAIYFLTSGRRA